MATTATRDFLDQQDVVVRGSTFSTAKKKDGKLAWRKVKTGKKLAYRGSSLAPFGKVDAIKQEDVHATRRSDRRPGNDWNRDIAG